VDSGGWDKLKKRTTYMGSFLRKQITTLAEYDEPLVRRLIVKAAPAQHRIQSFVQGMNNHGLRPFSPTKKRDISSIKTLTKCGGLFLSAK
jgi:hypothetical protein